jgi:hypothetical protein
MFVGHYGLGFMVKKKIKDIPLWLLFLSVQLMDIVAFILVFFGIEKAIRFLQTILICRTRIHWLVHCFSALLCTGFS